MHASLGGLNGIALVVNRRCGTSEIVNLIDLDVERKRHVVAQQLEPLVILEVIDVAMRPGEEVVEAEPSAIPAESGYAAMSKTPGK